MNFKPETFANFEFLGVSNLSKTVHKISKSHSHFQQNRNRKVKLVIFGKKLIKSQNNCQRTKINKLLLVLMDFIIKSL